MTTHYATLLDRFVNEAGVPIMRAQTESGRVLNIKVLPDDTAAAQALWGGSLLGYEYRGGRPFYHAPYYRSGRDR